MSPDLVVDVGNTRIKWGRCHGGRVEQMASLPPDDAARWRQQVEAWAVPAGARWLLAGVHPQRRDALRDWLLRQGFHVDVLESHRQLPISVHVENPERVGMDRLLNAVAVRSPLAPRRQAESNAAVSRSESEGLAIIVDAGSAVTVDLVENGEAFRGGAIFPGLRLMAQALHHYTAQLPLIEVATVVLPPGASTAAALATGILHAVAGGIERLASEMDPQGEARLFLTGGDAPLLGRVLRREARLWPEMTLEGLRHAGQGRACT